MKKKRGFSLLEMLVALAVVGILLVLGLQVGRSTMQRASITAAINEFVADFNYARQLATRENRYVAFDFNADGTAYNIRILRSVSLNPQLEDSYKDHKTTELMNGEKCFSNATDFAINSMGVIRQYPVNPISAPISVTMNFFRTKGASDEKDYEKIVTIFPTGGIKIENKKKEY